MKRSGTKGISLKEETKFKDEQQFFEKMYLRVIVVSMLAIIGLTCLIVFGYEVRYPRVFFGSLGSKSYIILLLVLVLPIITSGVGLFVVRSKNYINHYKAKNVMISASWTLPESFYEYYKQLIQNKFPMTLLQDNKFEIKLDEDLYSTSLKLIFEYDDDRNELHYLVTKEN